MADAVVLELLRPRALQVDVVAVALAEGGDHLVGGAGIDGVDGLVVEAFLEAGILEHGHRLAAVVDDHALALELVPREVLVGAAAGEEEAVLLVDLGEVQRRRLLALLERQETLGWRRLGDVHGSVRQAGNPGLAGRRNRMLSRQPLLLQEAARHRGDQRRIECGKSGELDADLLVQRGPPRVGIAKTESSLARKMSPHLPPSCAPAKAGKPSKPAE